MSARRAVKVLIFALGLVIASPAVAIAWVEKVLWRGESLFVALSQCLSLIPGRAGGYIRAAYYFCTLDECSWETHIGFGSVFTHRGVFIGRQVSTGLYCVMGHVRIGDGVMMGSRVSIPSGKRQHFDDSGRVTDKTRYDTVTIGRLTWVGEAAVIMSNVGERCVVSAGAVVAKDMPDGCVIGGNPAKVLKMLDLTAQPLAAE